MPLTDASLTLGGKRCRCPSCRHRTGRTGERRCASPESIGLELKVTAAGSYWAQKPSAEILSRRPRKG